jgi:hypothetical protein
MPASKSSSRKRLRGNRLVVRAGILPPAAQLIHLSDDQWELFVEEACRHRVIGGRKYVQVKRLGGAGDAGRDVEARLKPELLEDQWDLYQGKHYQSPLTPSDAFPELAKLFTNIAKKVFPTPRRYFFCSPRNAGPDLHDLIADPQLMQKRLLSDWHDGKTGLKTLKKDLTAEVEQLVQAFAFGRIQECLVRDLISLHSTNKALHYSLFGIETERGDDPAVPVQPTDEEFIYIEELIKAYCEHNGETITRTEIESSRAYAEHFSGSRSSFYCAEGLKRFSRDLFPEDEFGRLMDMVLAEIRPRSAHPN